MPLSNFVPRGFGFVHHSIAILYHQVPNLSITIRNLFHRCTGMAPAATGARWVGSSAGAAAAATTEGTTAYHVGDSTNIKWHEGSVSREARQKLLNQKGCVWR